MHIHIHICMPAYRRKRAGVVCGLEPVYNLYSIVVELQTCRYPIPETGRVFYNDESLWGKMTYIDLSEIMLKFVLFHCGGLGLRLNQSLFLFHNFLFRYLYYPPLFLLTIIYTSDDILFFEFLLSFLDDWYLKTPCTLLEMTAITTVNQKYIFKIIFKR